MNFISKRRAGANRLGAAVVEFAVICPVLFLLMAGGVEIGRGVMVQNILEESARAGCRVAAMEEGDREETLEMVDLAMASANLNNYDVKMDPFDPTGLERLQPVTVSVSIPYEEVSWLSFGFMSGRTLTGVCVMPAEGAIEESDGKKAAKKAPKKASKRASKK